MSASLFGGKDVSYRLIGPLAYQGKKGCRDARCTHFFTPEGMSEDCYGWHCSYCDQPCSSQGHRCDAARAVLDESARIVAASLSAGPAGAG